jgi:hypothetical protein
MLALPIHARRLTIAAIFLACSLPILAHAQSTKPAGGYATWSNGPSDSPDYFPIGVWLQSPQNAAKYQAIGINIFVGLWQGPTEAQLAVLEKANMPVICDQNALALANLNRKIIVGWLQQDEPDNAQSLPDGKGYGPPVTPDALHAIYDKMHTADPTRPIYLDLGQGVAWDAWIGRGVRTNHPEDYPLYAKSGDIVSYDIYPASSDAKDVAGKLWLVPFGVDRLRQWTTDQKFVWNDIETTHISNPAAHVTPDQVTTEVWMSIIHGSRGIVYFAHQFKPTFIEAGLLADPAMSTAVHNVNARIRVLAPVLNSPTIKDGAAVASSAPDAPVDIMVKHHDNSTYVLAVAMRDAPTQATFTLPNRKGPATVTVLAENRTLQSQSGRWTDPFAGFAVHLYQIADR